MLVPATMKLLGDANWWLPAWLDRLLPRLDLDSAHGVHEPGHTPGHPGHPLGHPLGHPGSPGHLEPEPVS